MLTVHLMMTIMLGCVKKDLWIMEEAASLRLLISNRQHKQQRPKRVKMLSVNGISIPIMQAIVMVDDEDTVPIMLVINGSRTMVSRLLEEEMAEVGIPMHRQLAGK